MASPSPLNRPSYSESQILAYFDLISLPRPDANIAASEEKHALDFLHKLQVHQLATIPFENLSLHYSPHHTLSIDPDDLYKKLVENKRGRGGYCMENNCFFGTVLRTLGFEVYSAGARVCEDGKNYSPWTHMINIVTLTEGRKYMLDVGFGGDGPTRPLPLVENVVSPGIGMQDVRLVKENIAPNSDSSQRLWIYQTRYKPEDQWRPVYCFTELEFLPADFVMMNFYTSQCRQCWFTYRIIAVRMIREGSEIVGKVSLNVDVVKRILNGQTERLTRCGSEEERVKALEVWFAITLTAEETRSIEGMVTDLGGVRELDGAG